MNISYTSRCRIDDLLYSTSELTDYICAHAEEVSQPKDRIDLIYSYVASLRSAAENNQVQIALKAANGLTSVNKGIADAQTASATLVIGELALAVTRHAIDTAKSLRVDSGMAF